MARASATAPDSGEMPRSLYSSTPTISAQRTLREPFSRARGGDTEAQLELAARPLGEAQLQVELGVRALDRQGAGGEPGQLRVDGKSLLPIGVHAVLGEFERGAELHGGGRAAGVGHLRGDGALPDQVVERPVRPGEAQLVGRPHLGACGADRLLA